MQNYTTQPRVNPSSLGQQPVVTSEVVSDCTFDELRELPQRVSLGLDFDAACSMELGQ